MDFISPLVEFRDIQKRYKNKQVLKGVSLSINYGEIFGLIGPSGGGKTTLLKILIGMTHTDGGEIYFEDKKISGNLNHLRKNTGFSTQDNMLFGELSIKENSFYFGKLYGKSNKEIRIIFSQLITLLSLSGFENTQVRLLSGGMAKRATLLVSLIHKPKLLILDEPTTGLDPVLRKSLWDYIHEINKVGTTILVTSHLLEEIEENCNKIAVLKNGQIATIGSSEQYKAYYGKDKTFNQIFQTILSS